MHSCPRELSRAREHAFGTRGLVEAAGVTMTQFEQAPPEGATARMGSVPLTGQDDTSI